MDIRFEKIIEEYLLMGVDVSNLRDAQYPYAILKYPIDRNISIEYIPENPIEFLINILNKQFNQKLTTKSDIVYEICMMIIDEIDPAPLFQYNLDEEEQKELILYLKRGLDTTYFKEEFDSNQLRKIRQGLQHSLDVSVYAKPCFTYEQMHVLYKAVLQGLDTSLYADPKYSREQMEELRFGLSLGLDISRYANPEIPIKQMTLIRESLYHSSYTNCLSNPRIPFPIIKFIAHRIKKRNDKIRAKEAKEQKFKKSQFSENE